MSPSTLQKTESSDIVELRRQAGQWLRERREAVGLSQRELAGKVGFDYYTFISQIEAGRGKVPSERYESYAKALSVRPREFGIMMLRFNDPHTYGLIFGTADSAATDVIALEERLRRVEAKLAD